MKTDTHTQKALFKILRLYAELHKEERLHDFPFSDIEDKIIELIILIVKKVDYNIPLKKGNPK